MKDWELVQKNMLLIMMLRTSKDKHNICIARYLREWKSDSCEYTCSLQSDKK